MTSVVGGQELRRIGGDWWEMKGKNWERNTLD